MISRRHFVQAAMATSALYGASGFGNWSRLSAQQVLSQDELIGTGGPGNVTLIHITDIHAQTQPVYFREPEVNLGVGWHAGQPPHLVGSEFRAMYGIERGSALDYALTYDDFSALAQAYGRMGGLDRIATVVKAIRADRPEALILDGGDTWQGSLPALRTQGQDMVDLFNLLGAEAMTSHWEFTLGSDRVREIVEGGGLNPAFLGANIFDAEWDEPVFDDFKMFERGGTLIAVIGQAFPYMPIANPGWMFPELSFGLRRERIAEVVQQVRAAGAEVVVLLSHNGFDVDRQFARDIPGIDVILTGHTHDALPEPVQVGNTFLIASGSHGKFVSRVDLDVQDGAMRGLTHRLIPIFSDVIAPDAEMAEAVAATRAPFAAEMSEVIGTSGSLLYRRGNFNGTWDDVICNALISQRDAQIALSPGFRWGAAILPGQQITREDIYNVTAMSYPNAYRTEMSGEMLKTIFEDVAANIFNPDAYYQQGGDMVRIGGMGYRIDPAQPQGSRISEMTLLETGEAIEPGPPSTAAPGGQREQGTEGPAERGWGGKPQPRTRHSGTLADPNTTGRGAGEHTKEATTRTDSLKCTPGAAQGRTGGRRPPRSGRHVPVGPRPGGDPASTQRQPGQARHAAQRRRAAPEGGGPRRTRRRGSGATATGVAADGGAAVNGTAAWHERRGASPPTAGRRGRHQAGVAEGEPGQHRVRRQRGAADHAAGGTRDRP